MRILSHIYWSIRGMVPLYEKLCFVIKQGAMLDRHRPEAHICCAIPKFLVGYSNETCLNSKVGNIVYYYKNIGTGYNSYVARLTELISDSEFPTERAFMGCMLSGSYHYISGYLDANKNGGIVCINFNGGGLFRVSSGTVSQIN